MIDFSLKNLNLSLKPKITTKNLTEKFNLKFNNII